VAGQVYTARVNATQYSMATGGHTSDWATSPAVTIMDVPQLTQVSYDAGFTTVRWTASAVPGAGYDIMLQPTQGGGQSFQATVNGPSPGGPAPASTQISMTGQSSWRYYNAQIRASSPNSAGAWSSPVAFTALDPPTGLKAELVVGQGGVTRTTASWVPAGNESFTAYLVTITAPDGTKAWEGTLSASTTFLDLDLTGPSGTLQTVVDYTLVVRTVGSTGALSAPTGPVHFTLSPPPLPPPPAPPLPPAP